MSHAPSPEDVAEYRRRAAIGQLDTQSFRTLAEHVEARNLAYRFAQANPPPRKAAHDENCGTDPSVRMDLR